MTNLTEIRESLPHSWPADEVFPADTGLDAGQICSVLEGRTILQALALPVGES